MAQLHHCSLHAWHALWSHRVVTTVDRTCHTCAAALPAVAPLSAFSSSSISSRATKKSHSTGEPRQQEQLRKKSTLTKIQAGWEKKFDHTIAPTKVTPKLGSSLFVRQCSLHRSRSVFGGKDSEGDGTDKSNVNDTHVEKLNVGFRP